MSGYCNQSLLFPECAARSVGSANQAFTQLIQTLMVAQCTLSEPAIWPEDYGKTAAQYGRNKRAYKNGHKTYYLCVFLSLKSNEMRKFNHLSHLVKKRTISLWLVLDLLDV